MICAKPLTDDQIRETVRLLPASTTAIDRDALLKQALGGDHAARFALAFWAKRLGITN